MAWLTYYPNIFLAWLIEKEATLRIVRAWNWAPPAYCLSWRTATGYCAVKLLREHQVRLGRWCVRAVASAMLIKISVALVRDRTIPTERLPLDGELSVNFCGLKVSCCQRYGSPRPYSRPSKPETLLFFPSSSSVVLTRLSGPVPDPLLLRKSGSSGNRTRDLWICSQELDH
jgi:hypothetical protein